VSCRNTKAIAFWYFYRDLGTAEDLLYALRQIDGSFRRRDEGSSTECIVNNKGFEVAFIYPLGVPRRFHSLQLTNSLGIGTSSAGFTLPSFIQTVISSTGKMGTMRVLTPAAFIIFSTDLARKEGRAPQDSARDLVQAAVVQEMLDAKMIIDLF